MARQRVNIVDDYDNLIGIKYRDELDPEIDRYQFSALWITNSKGEALIAQRKLTKDKDPGKWGPAVAGTLEEGETHESNIYKEAKEEIGLTDITFEVGPTQKMERPRKNFGQWYFVKIDRPADTFFLQEEEVEQLAWVLEKELKQDIKNNPDTYTPALIQAIDMLVR